MKGIENTTTDDFGSLIRSGKKYTVPKFQRDYSWDTEQWEDLWQDIERMLQEKDGDHYMGYLVLQTSDNENFMIIDGQQRFTTITMIVLAAIKAVKELAGKGIDPEKNEQRGKTLIETYIGHVDPVTLEYDNILVLNRNNDGYYKDYIVKLGDLKRTHISATEKLMRRCFEWYENALKGKFSSGEEYAGFIKEVVNNLFFTVITVNDETNAFRVFETLNARGVQLSSSDLIKNYLFSLVADRSNHPSWIETLEGKWTTLNNNLGIEKLPEYLRYYWNSKNKTVRSNELFKTVRTSITQPEQVFRLMDDLLDYSQVFIALRDPTSDYWENDTEITHYIRLLKLFNLRQPYSLLMTANKSLPNRDFKQVLKETIVLSFRYSVICGLNPNEIERTYNDAALYITTNKSYDSGLMKNVYIDDREFVAAFSIKNFDINSKSGKVVRYILGEIERFMGGNSISLDDESYSIEHIMPQSPDEDEWDMEDEKVDRLSSRLGNMCLLEKRLNKEAGNKSYLKKLKVYSLSNSQMTQRISEHYSERWDENTITNRQRKLAEKAKAIWRIG
ncbi:MAG: DUF262 domain-containing HNH endonuclease family protein [Mediterranea sp.]|jgi:uncharacterized protein with ParB-like and HNH nuclease domain|nr:DUF262 domain-containing HNH endonuclease family protein [Mediterranea sp.]